MSKTRSIMMLGSLGLLVMVVAGWFLLLSPRLGTASDLNAQRDAVVMQNQTTEGKIAELEQLKANIAVAKAEADELTNRFPPTAEQSELFALVRRAAATAGMPEDAVSDLTAGIPSLGAADGSVTLPEAGDPNAAPAATDPNAAPAPGAAPAAGTGGSQLATMSLDMTVTGTQVQIMRFLDALENMDRAYLIANISLGAGEGAGNSAVSATISGNMYLLPELVIPTDEPAAADPASGAEQAPAA